MLRIVQQSNAEAAKRYYSQADYYLAEGEALELRGNWGGKGAAMLGLSGQVDRASFEALCDNLHPATRGSSYSS
jgi:conjugative relaxase-like TrwC/TraI family protein